MYEYVRLDELILLVNICYEVPIDDSDTLLQPILLHSCTFWKSMAFSSAPCRPYVSHKSLSRAIHGLHAIISITRSGTAPILCKSSATKVPMRGLVINPFPEPPTATIRFFSEGCLSMRNMRSIVSASQHILAKEKSRSENCGIVSFRNRRIRCSASFGIWCFAKGTDEKSAVSLSTTGFKYPGCSSQILISRAFLSGSMKKPRSTQYRTGRLWYMLTSSGVSGRCASVQVVGRSCDSKSSS